MRLAARHPGLTRIPGTHGLRADFPFEGSRAWRQSDAVQRALRIFSALWRWWAAARTRNELHQLSDHALRDIGLRRNDIDSLYR